MSQDAFKAVLVKGTQVQSRPVSWLWPGRVPLGKVVMLGGDPGLGKSFLTTYLAAQVSTGGAFADAPSGLRKPGSVLMLSAEDDAGDTIRPRLEAHGADLSRVHFLDGVVRRGGDSRGMMPELDRHMSAIESAVRSLDRCRLVVVDPISAYLGDVDGNSNGEVRGLIRALSDMAGRLGPAVVCVTHLNKGVGGKAVYRMMGSLAFVAAARVAYYIAQDRTDPELRVMVPAKANLQIKRKGVSFKIEEGRVCFKSTDLELTDEEVDDPGRGDERSMVDDAREFLRVMLKDGPATTARLLMMATQAGISEIALRRAKKSLGVRVFKSEAADGPWMWAIAERQIGGAA